MHHKPKVSFVCSVRDGMGDIERCASSVLRQNFQDIELVFVDDHSKDSTWEIMEKIARSDDRVRAIRNYGREGLTYSLNLGLDFLRGEYVARIDVDDFAHANRVELQLAAMECNDSAAMATSCYRVVDEGDFDMYSHCPSSDPKLLRWSLCFRNNLRHSTAMWRKSLEVRYDPSFTYAQDYDMWCRISRAGDIVVVPEIVATIRSKSDSITSTKHNEQESAADMVSARQFEHYTGRSISAKEARHLRMVYFLKNAEQLRVFESMCNSDIVTAAINYCLLACGFANKENPEGESLLLEVGHDVTNAMQNPTVGPRFAEALREAVKEHHGSSWIAEEIDKRFF